jgi:hypothetical protein
MPISQLAFFAGWLVVMLLAATVLVLAWERLAARR